MATLARGIQAIQAELTAMRNWESAMRADITALQGQEGLQNLSLDERGRERTYRPFQGAPRPHNTKVQYFFEPSGRELPGLALTVPGHRGLPLMVRPGGQTAHVCIHEGHRTRVRHGHSHHGTGVGQRNVGRIPTAVSPRERLPVAAGSVCLRGATPQRVGPKTACQDEGTLSPGVSRRVYEERRLPHRTLHCGPQQPGGPKPREEMEAPDLRCCPGGRQ